MKKICTKCNNEKDAEGGFHHSKRNSDGHDPACKECRNAILVRWKLANPKRLKEHSAKWRRENPERQKEMVAQCRRANPVPSRTTSNRRRARLAGYTGAHYTAKDVADLMVGQQGGCMYCWTPLTSYHVDHVVPLSRGGGNGVDNICLACPSCNSSKNNKLLGLEWVPPYRADANKNCLAFQSQVL